METTAARIEESISAELANSSRLLVGVLDIRADVGDLRLTKQDEARVLDEIAGRVERSTRGTDPKGRLTGDRFVVVLPSLGNPGDVELVAEGVHRAIEGPYETGKGPVHPRIHVGAATSKRPSGARRLMSAAHDAADVAAALGLAVNIAGAPLIGTIRRRVQNALPRRKRRTDTEIWTGPRTDRRWRSLADLAEKKIAS